MTNKEIANHFQQLGQIMELHDENPFKIRSYKNVYIQLRKLDQPLADMTESDRSAIKGVGKNISAKIQELLDTGTLQTFQKYAEKTPPGIIDLLSLKGFGAKKIQKLWKELGVESAGELLYACNENRLIELKGFGYKTQEDLKNKLIYFLQSRNKIHYAKAEVQALPLIEAIRTQLPEATVELTGAMRRCDLVIEQIEIIIASKDSIDAIFDEELLILKNNTETIYRAILSTEFPVTIYHCQPDEIGSKQFRYTGDQDFITAFLDQAKAKDFKSIADEKTVFQKAGLNFVPPELRVSDDYISATKKEYDLITEADIKGIVHSHTTYSDGLHSLEEMTTYAKEQGFEYIVITDHSKAAFYANGLKPDRVLEQMERIDELNQQLAPFCIFKSIESDILNDGSLDYEEDILKRFDMIIASVHTNLKMDEAKANARLIKAIENPYTTMLGHPTGRLLLSRIGYPIDHKKIIDACAANGVFIELNANPYRLDLDPQWIPYALEKGVKISINPDAHSREGMHDIRYGVLAARRGGLTKTDCLNTLDAITFEQMIRK